MDATTTRATPRTIPRPLSRTRYLKYARDIRQGDWGLAGEAIKFNTEGKMCDGQHRCKGVIEAGMPITTLVVRNVEVHEFARMDTGKIRTMAGVFGIEGETAGSTLAGALRLLYLYNRNILAMPFPPQPTHNELKAEYRAWPLIHESLSVRSWCRRILSPSTTVFFHFLFARIDAEAANRFFVQLSRGEGLVHGMPVYILREKLTSIQRNKGRRRSRSRPSSAWPRCR